MSSEDARRHEADRECDGPGVVPADAGAARGGLEAEAPEGRRSAGVEVAFERLRSVVLDVQHGRFACGPVVRASWVEKLAIEVVRLAAGLLAPAATGGQCTVIAVGQYSTLRWCISASASRSW